MTKTSADAGFAGTKPRTATLIDIEVVRKPLGQVGFAVHPGDGPWNASSPRSAEQWPLEAH